MSLNSLLLREELAMQRASLLQSLATPVSTDGLGPLMTPAQRSAAIQQLRASEALKTLEAERQLMLNSTNLVAPISQRLTSNPGPTPQGQPVAPQDNSKDTKGEFIPAEFLLRLITMIEDNNEEIIEWKDGAIFIHRPDRLEKELLHIYFRHSKLTSFQRQLHYFGFRKDSGFGKICPCSYVNDTTTNDIKSLLKIKRKKLRKRMSAPAAVKSTASPSHAVTATDVLRAGAGEFGTMTVAPSPPPPGLLHGGMMLPGSMVNRARHQRLLQHHREELLLRSGLAPPPLPQLPGFHPSLAPAYPFR